jgi:cysteine synthase A
MIYDNILDTIGKTPVVRINRMAPEGITMYAKLEAFNPMGSVKDRLALGIILTLKTGALKPGQTVVEATSATPGSPCHGVRGARLPVCCGDGGVILG